MGLYISHDCWHGGYGSFNLLREIIALSIGIKLQNMEGFGGIGLSALKPEECFSWDLIGDEPLIVFLSHSDCDGSIKAADCKKIANRLEELLPRIVISASIYQRRWSNEEVTIIINKLINGMRTAASKRQSIKFG